MQSAFEKWAESKYGDSLMVPSGAAAAWNAAVLECGSMVLGYCGPALGSEIVRKLDALQEDFHSEGD